MTQKGFSSSPKCRIIEAINPYEIEIPKIILQTIDFKENFITRVYRFPRLSRIFRTHTKPVITFK